MMENKDTEPVVVICTCGAVIPPDDIYHYNGTNEEGEDYGVVEGDCPDCKKEWATSDWGSWENERDAHEYLKEYINPTDDEDV